MASSDLTGTSILDDFSAEERLAADADVSHGSLLDDEREADIGLEVQADNGISGDTSGGDDAVRNLCLYNWKSGHTVYSSKVFMPI